MMKHFYCLLQREEEREKNETGTMSYVGYIMRVELYFGGVMLFSCYKRHTMMIIPEPGALLLLLHSFS